jgi:hypothetical protein
MSLQVELAEMWYVFKLTEMSQYPSGTIVELSFIIAYHCEKSLKIPESVYRRRTDNAMPKEKVEKDKQRSTKHTHKTKDRVTRTPLKTGMNSGAPEW